MTRFIKYLDVTCHSTKTMLVFFSIRFFLHQITTAVGPRQKTEAGTLKDLQISRSSFSPLSTQDVFRHCTVHRSFDSAKLYTQSLYLQEK